MNQSQTELLKKTNTRQKLKRILGKIWKSRIDPKPRSIILNYHSFHPDHYLSTKPLDFQKQIELLQRYFKVINLSEFIYYKNQDLPSKGNYAVISICANLVIKAVKT